MKKRSLTAVMEQLTRPAPTITDVDQSAQARLLSSILLIQVMVLSIVFLSALLLPLYESFNAARDLAALILIVTLAEYLVSRRASVRVTAIFAIAATLIISFGVPLMFIDDPVLVDRLLTYSVLAVFIGSYTLDFRQVLVIAVGIVLGIVAVPFLKQQPTLDVLGALTFNLVGSTAIMIAAFLRRQTLHALRQSETRYRSLMNANFEAIVIYDTKNYILDVNTAFERITGRWRDEVIGQKALQFVAPEDRERVLTAWQRRQHTLPPLEVSVLHRSGRKIPVEMQFFPYQYQQKAATVIVGQDLTRRKQAEKARIEYEHRYRALFTQTSSAVFIIDLNGNIMSANEQASRLLGYAQSQLTGMHFKAFLPDTEQQRGQDVYQRLLSGETIPVYERLLMRSDGTVVPSEINIMVVHDADGQPIYLQSLVHDLSQRKRDQERQFELAVQHERVKMLQNFIGDTSHYFRTPISNLKTSLYLLPRFEDRPEKRAQHYDVMNNELARLEKLLNDLLMMARLEKEESSEFSLVSIDVGSMLHQAGEKARHSQYAQQKTINTVLPPPGLSVCVFGDKHRLAQAIDQMVDNALMYTRNSDQITLRCNARDGWCVIDIIDTGLGIGEADLPHIFNTFYRTDMAQALNANSSGLGLSIVHKIIEIHRGIILVESELNEGSHFQIILPLEGNWQRAESEQFSHILQVPMP